MKTLFISAFALLISVNAFSQDTLITRAGEVIPAKVHEINSTEIKYKKPSNPDGPLYVISKDEVAVIEYKNGSKDVFPLSGQPQQVAAGSTDPSANQGNASGAQQPSTQVNNNYYGNPNRPGVNLVLGMGGFWGVPYWGSGWGWYRPYYRSYYRGGWGGWHGGYGYGGGWHYGGGHGHHHR